MKKTISIIIPAYNVAPIAIVPSSFFNAIRPEKNANIANNICKIKLDSKPKRLGIKIIDAQKIQITE